MTLNERFLESLGAFRVLDGIESMHYERCMDALDKQFQRLFAGRKESVLYLTPSLEESNYAKLHADQSSVLGFELIWSKLDKPLPTRAHNPVLNVWTEDYEGSRDFSDFCIADQRGLLRLLYLLQPENLLTENPFEDGD